MFRFGILELIPAALHISAEQDRAIRQGSDVWAIIASLKRIAGLPLEWLFAGSARARQQPAQELIERGAGLEAMWVDEVQGMADLLSFDQADQHRLQALAQGRLLSQAQERIARLRGISSARAAFSRKCDAKRVEPALREALSAWQSLGAAKSGEAKPYSTANLDAFTMNLMGYPEATRLQETSALLNQTISERTGQKAAGPSKTGR